jgi:predicted enzyme related to lactoylglutathione lyase
MANSIVWCDIPVLDLKRAIRFYSAVLGSQVKQEQFPRMTIGILPHKDGEVGGCLFKGSDDKPSDQGAMIYLNANGRLDEAIAAVVPHGGKVLKPKHAIGPYGSRAIILDSEGNRIALHSDATFP